MRKPRLRRIMVAMPQEMFEDFKEKAEQSGLSMSRIIYLRLKAKGGMLLVPHAVLRAVEQLVQAFQRILDTAALSESDRLVLQRIVEFEAKLVRFQDDFTTVHGREVKK